MKDVSISMVDVFKSVFEGESDGIAQTDRQMKLQTAIDNTMAQIEKMEGKVEQLKVQGCRLKSNQLIHQV